MNITQFRRSYQQNICKIARENLWKSYLFDSPYSTNNSKQLFTKAIISQTAYNENIEGSNFQSAEQSFEGITKCFIETMFSYLPDVSIEYRNLSNVELDINFIDDDPYIFVYRWLLPNTKYENTGTLKNYIQRHIHFSQTDVKYIGLQPKLHALVCCKLSISIDSTQSTRTELLNLVRNHTDYLHNIVVTAEPSPIAIAALALGTGDLDCVYHFALHELIQTVTEANNQESLELLNIMVHGRRLRDISDLPFDLAI